jgi:uncharacterized FlaG/YvyC family protein
MSNVTVTPLTNAHLDAALARPWSQQKQTSEDLPTVHKIANTDNTTLSYSFDSSQQCLRIVITDKTSGEVLRHIEFKSFQANLHRTDKLSGLLLDKQA